MLDVIEPYLPPVFAVAAVLYLALAVRVARSSPDSLIALFLYLIGCMVGGAAFSNAATSENIFAIGRVLSFLAAGFIPVTFYAMYREYTIGRAPLAMILVLSVLPFTTVVLTLTNPLHHMIWESFETANGLRFSDSSDHFWFTRVHAPYAFGLFGFSAIALLIRLPMIARAHRRLVLLLLAGAAIPFTVSLSNNLFGVGESDFPFTALSLVVMLPLYTYAVLSMRMHSFSPFAYPTVFHHVRDALIVLDNDERIVCANRAAQVLLNASESDLIGQELWRDFPEARAVLREARNLDLTQTLRFSHDKTYEVSVAQLIARNGEEQGTVVVCRDVTERRRALEKLAQNEQLIRSLIETSSNGILRFARDENDAEKGYRCVFANRAAEGYLDERGESLVGTPLSKLAQLEPDTLLERFEAGAGAGRIVSIETSIESGHDETWLRIVAEPVDDDLSITMIDITQRKLNEDKMLADALRDPLTGVLNRRGFEQEAAASIRRHEVGAVLYLDLNHFKTINDRFGHRAGDALLKAFGHRLEFCLRPEDVLGRLGGDEFAIILPGVEVEDAKHVAERVVQTASEAYIIQGQEMTCTASVGIALMPKHGEELWHLISVADEAMYNVKQISAQDAANDRSAYIEAATAN